MTAQVREVMTLGPVTVAPDTPVTEVARVMRDRNIGAVLVVDGGRLRGLVTDRDLTVRILAEDGDASARTVAEACSPNVVCVAPEDDLDRAVQLMRGRALRRLPVVDDGQPVGMVTLGDVAVDQDPTCVLARITAAEPNL
ncbi:CBS domain-containing protein [Streptomyces griseoviridis]|jgi:CBS domain-containing protein|uniref:CBS domain-containing protein n=3 Tax=Streptomyces TaxID=1883 RepID=A0ABT9L8P8_STRGD|nr:MULTISPECIES: CBS domain-containing protein [Streptomyces]MDP9680081.1 CBS domain-containing protein [Streptomyces griseoviridis]GGS47267.1 oxidoreductase [Streptomyces niveoruber]GGT05333.1 oxidoreductase [Streptomyces griseoviridis]GGU66105.1 oxidoreductase [Streptomyces daghestanicus]GHI29405.1 oxidoreductase [Streptomyces daghestanicus]